MIKPSIIFFIFYLIIGVLHYFLLPYLPEIKPLNDFYLIYVVLFTVSIMGNTLFFFNKKLELINFSGVFIAFTVIQLLAAMSFSLAIKLIREDNSKIVLIHFVIVFFVTLIFQSIYLINNHKNLNDSQ